MAIEYLKPTDLKQAIEDSESYMKPYIAPLREYERLGRAKPGRVPKGKPRVTDGTLAGKRREVPKEVIQQLPTGKVHVKNHPDIEKYAQAVLSDEILPNANTGGTPFSKSKRALKLQFDNGSVAAYVFFNMTGDKFHADYKLVKVRDLLFEKGKTSEFDSNFITIKEWYTKTDLTAELQRCKQLKSARNTLAKQYVPEWDEKVLQELIDGAEEPKDSDNKSENEQSKTSEDNGFILLYNVMQRGVGAKFYRYSMKLNKVAYTCTNKDPRGIIPVHVLTAEEDDESPIGEPLFAISAGKQNLLDFKMQLQQYREGIELDPPVKKWGDWKKSNLKLVPGIIIELGNKATNDFEPVDLTTSSSANFAQDYGLIKSQILNELGTATADTSISAEAGNPSFSKTSAGVNAQQQRTDVFNNDLRKTYEEWQARIFETLLNIQFAYSSGTKVVDLEPATRKQLDLTPEDKVEVNYDKDIGPIKYVVDPSTSEQEDDTKQNERLSFVLELITKFQQPTAKQMMILNQIIQTSGVADPEKYQYTDDEIAEAQELEQQAKEAAALQASMPPQEEVPAAGLEAGMPMDAAASPEQLTQFSPDEQELIDGLLQRGVPNEDIATALTMYRNGYDDQQILTSLGIGVQQ